MSFKVRLLLGAAAPLVFVLPAAAQTTTINTATTAPVATTGNNIDITSAGSITLPADTPNQTAVTVNSSNTVATAGAITINNGNNSTAVRIQSGFNTGFTQSAGAISVLESYERTDTDNDGDLDGPLAQGTDRFGLLVAAGGTMTGNITLGGGSITVEGNNSGAVSIRSILNGSYSQDNALSVTGSNSFGLDFQDDVTGNVLLSGSVNATGEGSVGVRSLGDVGGEFINEGAINATGFTSTTVRNYRSQEAEDADTTDTPAIQLRDADDLLVGGSALVVRGDLARGFLNNGLASGGVDTTPTVKDSVQDFNEDRGSGVIATVGSAPAVDISPLDGAAGAAIVFGKVRESVRDTTDDDGDSNTTEIIATFNYDYGLMNRGTISANGWNVGFNATALRIAGSADGTHTTTIEGGVQNTGQIVAQAFEANAIAVDFGAGASTPLLLNSGAVSSIVETRTDHDATGVLIRSGANLPSVVNNGFIGAQTRGYSGDAVAFRDLSGSVRTFTNSSRVAAGHVDNNTTDTITSGTGKNIALDFSASTLGVTLTQSDVIDNARIFGDILFGSGADRFDLLSGQTIGDVDFGAGGADALNINSALLTGDAVFRGATANVTFANQGSMLGDINFGAAAANFSLAGGAAYDGVLTNTGAGRIALAMDNATLTNRSTGTLALSSMTLANGSRLNVDITDARLSGGLPVYRVFGAASLSANTRISPVFSSVQLNPFSVRVLQADSLTLGGPVAAMLDANVPFLYSMNLTQAANAVDLNLRVKTSNELGFSGYQESSYTAVLNLLAADDDIGSAFAAYTGQTDFIRAVNDLLPPNDTSLMKVLAANSSAALGVTGRRLELIMDKPNAPGGAWLEQFGLWHDAGTTDESLPTSGGGFGVAGGFDLIASRDMVIGAFLALESVKLEEENRTGAPMTAAQTSVGAYAGRRWGSFAVNGSASYGFVEFDDKRDIAISGLTDKINGAWKGNTIAANARAVYTIPIGFLEARPYVGVDALMLNQEGYTETAVGDLDGLALIVGDAESHLATATAGLSLAASFGGGASDFQIDPEISVGWRQVLSFDSSPATARFTGQNTPFLLARGVEPENAITAGVGFNVGSQYLNMKVGYDAEFSDQSTTHYGSITLRMAFW